MLGSQQTPPEFIETPTRVVTPYDELSAFAAWFQHQPFAIPPSIADGMHRAGVFTGVTLYRQGQFQVQMWLCPPDSEIPDHCHPSVDQWQYYISGEVYLRLNGEPVIRAEQVRTAMNGLSNKNGYAIRVGPTDYHGATIGKRGGVFLNIQRWVRGEPKSVELDWEGEPLDEAHGIELERQRA